LRVIAQGWYKAVKRRVSQLGMDQAVAMHTRVVMPHIVPTGPARLQS